LALVRRLIRSLHAARNLGNPLHVLRKRAFGHPGDTMLVRDRRTGIHCACAVAAYPMFASTWYSHDYDVPRVPIGPGDVVFDIGAHQGFFSCYAAQRDARVFAFEPNPESFARLLENVEANGLSDRVVAKPWAIGAQDGTAELLVSEELGGGMTTLLPTFAENAHVSIRERLAVPCHTLPQVLDMAAPARVRLCKIDAEGSELDILRPLEPRHLAIVDSFVIEPHPEAYPLPALLDLIATWGTHQAALREPSEFSVMILRVVANRIAQKTSQQ